MIGAAIALAAAPAGQPAVLRCNTIDADGQTLPVQIGIDSEKTSLSISIIGSENKAPIAVSDVSFEREKTFGVTFKATLSGKMLKGRLWHGFSRPFSLVDGEIVGGEIEGLIFLTGICTSAQNFVPITHRFSEDRYATRDGKIEQRCFSVTLDGRHFSAFLSYRNGVSKFSTEGLGQFDVQNEQMKMPPTVSPLQEDGYFKGWQSYHSPEKNIYFMNEMKVHKKKLMASEYIDYQVLGSRSDPLMVARGHCGIFAVTEGTSPQ